MQKVFMYTYKIFKKIGYNFLKPFDYVLTYFLLYSNGVQFTSFKTVGLPRLAVSLGGQLKIGPSFKMNNREYANPIGRFNRCSFFIGKKGKLEIGKNVGISSSTIVCQNNIEIGDNVKIGGNVVIYDTDFHSLNPQNRLFSKSDIEDTNILPIKIGNNAFIGAHSTILKGVTIGENAIVGACSVVTKSIPKNEIWAGNPAKFIKNIEL